MLVRVLIAYYVLSLIYVTVIFILRRKGAGLQAMMLIACPFISLFLLYAMSRTPNRHGMLPDWLLRREQYEDVALRPPDTEAEINIIPIDDALVLNDNKIKRKMLIDLLKGEFMKNVDALELALQNEDSETSHYAATAVQQAKSDLLKNMRGLEAQLADNEADYDVLEAYRDTLKQYIRIEFLDENTRKKYMYSYLQTLDKLIHLSPARDARNLEEKIKVALSLNEHKSARETAEQFLALFPDHEEAYFCAMNVHFHMRNEPDFKHVLNQLASSGTRLSPDGLNQLRFWLQGDVHEQQV
ncbi:hypothetical protein BTO30_03780 [Domibacillus antri]|uniref:Uncharacterized protein n=1 Tax=Domibacillus antri TaxID=1714264 RepID=A0A1Q8Q8E2_9BACI|nr:hypothetical protein [Domibacillus antri]OLN23555.1 hypothetical protein BTO30_03780 [Domibacillus antri]